MANRSENANYQQGKRLRQIDEIRKPMKRFSN